MSLHDVDKNSEDRGNPTPNTNDTLIGGAIKSHKTLSTHYTTDADTIPGRLQMQNKQVIANDGTTPVGLFGYNNAMQLWGLFQTKPGTDVTTNTDPSKFIFNSNQDVFKIVGTGNIISKTTTITWTTTNQWAYGTSTSLLAHGLNFIPTVIAVLNFGGDYTPLPFVNLVFTSIPMWASLYCYTDATNVYFSIDAMGNSGAVGASSFGFGPYTAKYFLLQESAS
jgi:hypothetical protein